MDDLTFRLPGLKSTKGELTDFEGPLSLILQLLSRNRVEIQDIRIGDILDQYLEWLAGMERMDLEVTGEFITMASYLLYIKARTLLEGTRDVEELDELISSLEAQQRKETLERMKQAASWLSGRSSLGEGLFLRSPEPISGPPEYTYAHRARELIRALREIMSRERSEGEAPRTVPMPAPLTYSIRDNPTRSSSACGTGEGSLCRRFFSPAAAAASLPPPSWRCWSSTGPSRSAWRTRKTGSN